MHETVLASSLLSILQDTVVKYANAHETAARGTDAGKTASREIGTQKTDARGTGTQKTGTHETGSRDSGNARKAHDSEDICAVYATGEAQRPHALHIEEVVVTVGLLSCVEPQTLRGCFEIMAEGTVAHKALLTIVTRPMKGVCPDCGQKVETVERRFSCPLCHGTQVDWQDGRGMEITSIRVVEVETGKSV